jgi:DNA polymerase-3 subunit delta
MKLPLAQLETHLSKKTLAPIYLVSGDELLLTQEAIDQIRAAARKAGYTEHVRVPMDSNEWGKQLYASANTLSLFADKRIVELDLRGAKMNQGNSALLQTYAEHPAADTIVIIHIHKLDSKTEQSRWFQAIDKAGATIAVWPVPAEQLPQWVMQRAKKYQLNLSKQSAEWLANQSEGNLFAAAQEIEKLSLLPPDTNIEEAVTDNAHYDVFALVESVLAGNRKRSLRILQTLYAEDTEPPLILWALTREIRTMADIARQQQQGTALSALFSKFRIWDKRQPSVRAFLQRTSVDKCWQLLMSAASLDRTIKGMQAGNARNELEQWILQT